MRKVTVRSGLRFIATGIILVMLATFFPGYVASILFLGMGAQARLILLGFFLGGAFGGWGVLVAALGLLQTGRPEDARVRLAPTVLFLLSLIILFFVLAYNSLLNPVQPIRLQPGESISI